MDSAADRVVAKRDTISRFLAKGIIVCVQETHWTDADAALWQHGLLFRQVQYSPAVPKQNLTRTLEPATPENGRVTGRCGGVATLLPPGYQFVEPDCKTLVPGFAILSTIRTPANDIVLVANMYLRPTAQATLWDRARRALPDNANLDPSLLLVGDFNLDLENEEVSHPHHWMQSRRSGRYVDPEATHGGAGPKPKPWTVDL